MVSYAATSNFNVRQLVKVAGNRIEKMDKRLRSIECRNINGKKLKRVVKLRQTSVFFSRGIEGYLQRGEHVKGSDSMCLIIKG